MNWEEVLVIIKESLNELANNFLSPSDRLFIPYLIISFLMGALYFFFFRPNSSLFKYLFPKANYLGKSAIVDYQFLVFNSFIKILFIAPFLIWSLQLSYFFSEFLTESFGFIKTSYSLTTIYLIYGLMLLLIGDFFSFFVHYLMHKIPFLWEFHKVHHSSTAMNPITQYRIHPIELFLNNFRMILSMGLINGLADYLFQGRIATYTFIGVTLGNFLFLAFGSNLRHSHIPLKYFSWLEYILISPFQHQIHHSNQKELFDKNMGSKLAIWDKIFGTLVKSKDVHKLSIGLGEEDKEYTSFIQNLWNPFVKAFRINKLKLK